MNTRRKKHSLRNVHQDNKTINLQMPYNVMQVNQKLEVCTIICVAALRGYPCHVSVNVGTSDLLEHDVVSQVEEALSRYDGRPEDLSLEMTETGLVSEPGHVSIVLHRLHEMNVNCSIDDFGTGYSSLSYLSEFPVTGIKIDREFVGGMLSDGRKRAIVESSVNLAHAMELNVVAEGPEDTSTVKALIDMGCDLAQGFVYSPPLPASEFKQYYRSFGLK